MSGHQHLAPHLTLVLLGGGRAGQAQELVENLGGGEKQNLKTIKEPVERGVW